MSNNERVKIEDLRGILYDPATADIPAEYRVGLGRGRLGDWMQEVHDAGWSITIGRDVEAMDWHAVQPLDRVTISRPDDAIGYYGVDEETHNIEYMFIRAFIPWRKRDTP